MKDSFIPLHPPPFLSECGVSFLHRFYSVWELVLFDVECIFTLLELGGITKVAEVSLWVGNGWDL